MWTRYPVVKKVVSACNLRVDWRWASLYYAVYIALLGGCATAFWLLPLWMAVSLAILLPPLFMVLFLVRCPLFRLVGRPMQCLECDMSLDGHEEDEFCPRCTLRIDNHPPPGVPIIYLPRLYFLLGLIVVGMLLAIPLSYLRG